MRKKKQEGGRRNENDEEEEDKKEGETKKRREKRDGLRVENHSRGANRQHLVSYESCLFSSVFIVHFSDLQDEMEHSLYVRGSLFTLLQLQRNGGQCVAKEVTASF